VNIVGSSSQDNPDVLRFEYEWGVLYIAKDYAYEEGSEEFRRKRRISKYALDGCEAVRQYGSHQYERVNEDGRYMRRCIACGERDDEGRLTAHRYVTPLGIIDEWLMERKSRTRKTSIEGDEEDDLEMEDEYFAPPVVNDLGLVYEARGELGQDKYGKWTPTAPMDSAVNERKQRYGRILKHQELREKLNQLLEARKVKLKQHWNEIAEACRKNPIINPAQLTEALNRIETCLNDFDLQVARVQVERGRTEPDDLLSDGQLRALVAAAAYHYLPLKQQQVVDRPESIFPDVARSTFSAWLSRVKLYDPRPYSSNET
jgi:hypothetical protein